MPLWLLGIGSWLKDALRAAWDAICGHPREVIIIALCALSLWFLHGRQDARQELADIRAAQKVAGQAQVAVNHEPARKSEEIARTSNAEAPAYYDSVRRAAAANSVRRTCPVSGPDLPRADSAEQGVHGPDAAAELVCRPAVEDSQIVTAAARGAEMRQEGLDLIALGVAVPSE